MKYRHWFIVTGVPLVLLGCSDSATFVTGTDIGITANADTQQVQIGYSRAELFQGPNYPDVGDAPEAVGFLGSDLQIFSPHIRQLYATGDAAGIVTTPTPLQPCPPTGQPAANSPPNLCPEQPATLTGERRPLVFSTGTNVGLKLGFTGNAPSSIQLGYDREELSVIPLHSTAPTAGGTDKPDKYSSVLASLDMNVSAPNFLGSGLQMTQFFATGAAARNLAKNPYIQDYFQRAAVGTVNAAEVGKVAPALTQDQKDIDAYFTANAAQSFPTVRDKLLKDPQLAADYSLMTGNLTSATTSTAFDNALRTSANATFIDPIATVARRLNPSPAPANQS